MRMCRDYLAKLLDKQAFDKSGLIYGMGHAVYSLSDPRADIMRAYVERLSEEKHRHEDYELYAKVERLAPEVIAEKRAIYKGVAGQRGLLFRLRQFDARHSHRTVHAHLCHRAHCRLERAPH